MSSPSPEVLDLLGASQLGVRFVFDAGPTARLYLPDVATANLRRIFERFAGHIHSPSLVYTEVTAAWLQAVRDQHLSWREYEVFLGDFHQDLVSGFLRTWQDDELLPGVLSVQERVTRLHQERPGSIPILHAHDAYYVALAETIARDSGDRVVLVTNDARVWRCGHELGLEVFHGNTCDLGKGVLNIGTPGQDYPEGVHCCPCGFDHCPSTFVVDLDRLPSHLGSGTPRSARERRSRRLARL